MVSTCFQTGWVGDSWATWDSLVCLVPHWIVILWAASRWEGARSQASRTCIHMDGFQVFKMLTCLQVYLKLKGPCLQSQRIALLRRCTCLYNFMLVRSLDISLKALHRPFISPCPLSANRAESLIPHFGTFMVRMLSTGHSVPICRTSVTSLSPSETGLLWYPSCFGTWYNKYRYSLFLSLLTWVPTNRRICRENLLSMLWVLCEILIMKFLFYKIYKFK